MGRKSIKENKNIYFLSREECGMTRETAAEALEHISADRIEKIENEKSAPHPDEVITMSKVYKNPGMCNYFCTHECPIGREHIPEVESKAIEKITLEMLNTLNTLESEKNRLIEITVDGVISDDEMEDFERIKDNLEKMNNSINSLNLWIENAIANRTFG